MRSDPQEKRCIKDSPMVVFLWGFFVASSHGTNVQSLPLDEISINQQSNTALDQNIQLSLNSYILGPGDSIHIELLDLPELSGEFKIGPDGSVYINRLRSIYIEV